MTVLEKYPLAKKVDSTVPVARWVASLSNGETIYDDAKKGAPPAWERLTEYVEENSLDITMLRLQICGTEIKLPRGQEGYIQKKVAWSTGDEHGLKLCIGYAQGGLALIHEVDTSRGSKTIRGVDPCEPWTIYRSDIRMIRS